MKTLAVIVLLAAFSAPALAKDKNVFVKTDRFTGKTIIVMKAFGITPFLGKADVTQDSTIGVSLSLAAVVHTEDSDNVSFVVYVYAAHWQFLNGADVHMLADGQPIDLGLFVAATSHVDATDDVVTTNEAIVGHANRSTLDRMTNAKDLQIEVGNYQCRVNPKNIQRLKEFSDALPLMKAAQQ